MHNSAAVLTIAPSFESNAKRLTNPAPMSISQPSNERSARRPNVLDEKVFEGEGEGEATCLELEVR